MRNVSRFRSTGHHLRRETSTYEQYGKDVCVCVCVTVATVVSIKTRNMLFSIVHEVLLFSLGTNTGMFSHRFLMVI